MSSRSEHFRPAMVREDIADIIWGNAWLPSLGMFRETEDASDFFDDAASSGNDTQTVLTLLADAQNELMAVYNAISGWIANVENNGVGGGSAGVPPDAIQARTLLQYAIHLRNQLSIDSGPGAPLSDFVRWMKPFEP